MEGLNRANEGIEPPSNWIDLVAAGVTPAFADVPLRLGHLIAFGGILLILSLQA
jgi:hypothetical protein